MTLLLRSLKTISLGLLQPKLKRIDEPVTYSYRVLPIDLDVMRHMNHSRHLNYMEATRWGMLLRSGIVRSLMKHHWLLPISNVHIEYLRPLKLWQKFTVTAHLAGLDDKAVYVYHEFKSGDKLVARAVLRGMVKKGRDTIPPLVFFEKLGYGPPAESDKFQAILKKFSQD